MLVMKIILTMIISGAIVAVYGEYADNEILSRFGAGTMFLGGLSFFSVLIIAIWSM